MSSEERSDEVALLFEKCIDIEDLAERTAFLDGVCAGDSELREEIELLLRAHDASGRFLSGEGMNTGRPVDFASDSEEPGNRVGPYRLLGLIGEGSTSKVYLAEQEEPVRRWLALKIVKPGMDTRKVILRFGLERQALALMDHPGIAKLLDAGATFTGRPFFVMELVTGVGITEYCDERQLTIRERLELFNKVCDAVFHAHQRGIIHRDLKPDNVLVSDSDGRVVLKIIDFGIAKVLHSSGLENATQCSGLPFLGTPAYMSPEQTQLTSPDLDTRTDIYSLGALLYELLTGHAPFDHEHLTAASLEEMFRILRFEEPLPPSVRVTRLPFEEQIVQAEARGTTPVELRRILEGDLDWIALKALEKSRERRYATAAGLQEDITRHFESRPVLAVAPSFRYRMTKLFRRNRKLVIAAGVAGTLSLVGVFLIVAMAIRAELSANKARDSERVASQAERESHRAMVAMHVSSGFSETENQHPDRAVLWFANAARVAGEGSDEEDVNKRLAMCWLSSVPIPIGAFQLPTPVETVAFSADSRFLFAKGSDHSWRLWDSDTQELLPWIGEIGPIETAAWSPEDARLAVASSAGEVQVYDVSSGALLHAIPSLPVPSAIGFTPDAKSLVFGGSSLRFFDLERGIPTRDLPPTNQKGLGLTFAAESSHFVEAFEDGHVRVLPVGSEDGLISGNRLEYPHRIAIRTDACTSKSNYREDFLDRPRLSVPALDAAGTRLLTRTGTYEVTLWDLMSGESVFEVDDVCCSCRFIFSPESGLLACGLQGGKVGIWEMASGRPYQMLPSHDACILDMAFGGDGNSLITAEANGMARLWALETGTEIQSPLHHCTDVDQVAFARNGSMVATAQADGLVRIWTVLDYEPDEEHVPNPDAVPSLVRANIGGRQFVITKEPGWDASLRYLTVYSTESDSVSGHTLSFENSVETAAFSPDSSVLAVGLAAAETREDGWLEFVRVNENRRIGQTVSLPSPPLALAWSPSGKQLAVICKAGERLVVQPSELEVRALSPRTEDSPKNVNPQIAYALDGSVVVSLGLDGKIEICDSLSGVQRMELEASPDSFWSFTLSSDGRFLATATLDGVVAVWDIELGERIGESIPHPNWVYRCRFSSDGRFLVTASHDGKVRLWDWRAGQLLSGPIAHPSEVFDAALTPDNRWLLTACRDGKVRVWEPRHGYLLAPPIDVGEQAFNIEFTGDGSDAVIGNLGDEQFFVSLEVLRKSLPYDSEALCRLGEVVSGCIVESGAIRDLSTSEWIERYDHVRHLYPEALQAGKYFEFEKKVLKKTFAAASAPFSSELTMRGATFPETESRQTVETSDDACAACLASGTSCPLDEKTK